MGLPDPNVCKDPETFDAALAAMNEVLFTGLFDIGPEGRREVVEYVMDKGNWAKRTKRGVRV